MGMKEMVRSFVVKAKNGTLVVVNWQFGTSVSTLG